MNQSSMTFEGELSLKRELDAAQQEIERLTRERDELYAKGLEILGDHQKQREERFDAERRAEAAESVNRELREGIERLLDGKQPNPGSDAAIALGCKCPVIDNGHGNGCGRKDSKGRPLFWISGACELHSTEETNGREAIDGK